MLYKTFAATLLLATVHADGWQGIKDPHVPNPAQYDWLFKRTGALNRARATDALFDEGIECAQATMQYLSVQSPQKLEDMRWRLRQLERVGAAYMKELQLSTATYRQQLNHCKKLPAE